MCVRRRFVRAKVVFCGLLVSLQGSEIIIKMVLRGFVARQSVTFALVMAIDNNTLGRLNAQMRGTLMESIGMTYTAISDGHIEAIMPVCSRTCQPWGLLHGGASLALAETIAGAGSTVIIPDDHAAVGMQVSANHVWSARVGATVKATGTLIHRGHTTHVWNIDVTDPDGRLISSIRVTNCIIPKP